MYSNEWDLFNNADSIIGALALGPEEIFIIFIIMICPSDHNAYLQSGDMRHLIGASLSQKFLETRREYASCMRGSRHTDIVSIRNIDIIEVRLLPFD